MKRKRILSMALVLAMLLTMIYSSTITFVYASGFSDITEALLNGDYTITTGGDYIISNNTFNRNITVKSGVFANITIDNVILNAPTGKEAFTIESGANVNLIVSGTNSFTGTVGHNGATTYPGTEPGTNGGDAFKNAGNLILSGSGTLTVIGGNGGNGGGGSYTGVTEHAGNGGNGGNGLTNTSDAKLTITSTVNIAGNGGSGGKGGYNWNGYGSNGATGSQISNENIVVSAVNVNVGGSVSAKNTLTFAGIVNEGVTSDVKNPNGENVIQTSSYATDNNGHSELFLYAPAINYDIVTNGKMQQFGTTIYSVDFDISKSHVFDNIQDMMTDFSLGTTTAAYNADTNTLVINAANLTSSNCTADLTKIMLCGVKTISSNVTFGNEKVDNCCYQCKPRLKR